tara:strand:+ start:89 stop:418 length:330 start_codon:yes stop_codon:yes gene_type:complete
MNFNKEASDYDMLFRNKPRMSFFQKIENAHSSIDNIIDQAKLMDDFRFGQHGNLQTNLLESLIGSSRGKGGLEDLLKLSLSAKMGKNKGTQLDMSGSKGNFGLNLSKLF